MQGAFLICLQLQDSVSYPTVEGVWKEYACASCGEINETLVDPIAGLKQSYVEDCAVCCRPNVLHVLVEPSSGSVVIEAVNEE